MNVLSLATLLIAASTAGATIVNYTPNALGTYVYSETGEPLFQQSNLILGQSVRLDNPDHAVFEDHTVYFAFNLSFSKGPIEQATLMIGPLDLVFGSLGVQLRNVDHTLSDLQSPIDAQLAYKTLSSGTPYGYTVLSEGVDETLTYQLNTSFFSLFEKAEGGELILSLADTDGGAGFAEMYANSDNDRITLSVTYAGNTSAVPEPAAYGMLGAGLLFLAMLGRKGFRRG